MRLHFFFCPKDTRTFHQNIDIVPVNIGGVALVAHAHFTAAKVDIVIAFLDFDIKTSVNTVNGRMSVQGQGY